MPSGVTIEIKDAATPYLDAAAAGIAPSALDPIAGRAGVSAVRSHLYGLEASRPNKLGGPRQHYYGEAVRATHYRLMAGGVLVAISHVGMALRYFGGVVRPVNVKRLTIPVSPQAYGRRARQMDLDFIFRRRPGREPFMGLARKGAHAGGRGDLMFVLVKSATIKADRSLLPTEAELAGEVVGQIGAHVARILARRAAA